VVRRPPTLHDTGLPRLMAMAATCASVQRAGGLLRDRCCGGQDNRTIAAEGLPELSAIRFPHNLLSGNKKNPDQHFKQLVSPEKAPKF